MFEQIRIVVAIGLLMLLLLLRLESEQFGAAEYDEPKNRYHRGFWTRLSWYLLGLSLLAALYFVHPQPHDVLYLVLGHRIDALSVGLVLALVGVVQAAAFALYRYRSLRLPPARAYPGAAINAIATAVIDEAVFRGALLGMLVALHLPGAGVVLVQAVVYALATRLGASGRHPYMLFLSLGIGVAGGWATLQTGGIGAAILGHALTTFALFIFTGHAGQVARRGRDPEELERGRRAPEGWQDARRLLLARSEGSRSGLDAEPRGLIEPDGQRLDQPPRVEPIEPKNLRFGEPKR